MLAGHDEQMGMWTTVLRTWFYVGDRMQACDEGSSQPLGLTDDSFLFASGEKHVSRFRLTMLKSYPGLLYTYRTAARI